MKKIVIMVAMSACALMSNGEFVTQINTNGSIVDFMNQVDADLARIDAEYQQNPTCNNNGNNQGLVIYPMGSPCQSPLDAPMMKALDQSISRGMESVRKMQNGTYTEADRVRDEQEEARWNAISAHINADAARAGAYNADKQRAIKRFAQREVNLADREYLRQTGQRYNPQRPISWTGPEYEIWEKTREVHQQNRKYGVE